jgi:hypothetical protein
MAGAVREVFRKIGEEEKCRKKYFNNFQIDFE